jgi:hypothetical protein
LFMAPFSPELEPPQNPVRFSCSGRPCAMYGTSGVDRDRRAVRRVWRRLNPLGFPHLRTANIPPGPSPSLPQRFNELKAEKITESGELH